jgi:hypothetical protein
MSIERMPRNEIAAPSEKFPYELEMAVKLLFDSDKLNEIISNGEYHAIARRVVTFVSEFQAYRGVDFLSGDDLVMVKQGITRVLNLRAVKKGEATFLLDEIKNAFKKEKISELYFEDLDEDEMNDS